MAVKLKNFTGKPITIRTKDRDINLGVDGPPPGFAIVSRNVPPMPVDLGEESIVHIDLTAGFVEAGNLPDPEEGVALIVLDSMALNVHFRDDLLVLGNPIFDGEGKLEAYDGLHMSIGLAFAVSEALAMRSRVDSAEELMDGLRGEEQKQEVQPAA